MAARAASGVLRPGDLLVGLARIVTEQVVALAAVDPVELDRGADVVERQHLDADGGAGQRGRRRRARQLVGRGRVGVGYVEITAAKEQQGSPHGDASGGGSHVLETQSKSEEEAAAGRIRRDVEIVAHGR